MAYWQTIKHTSSHSGCSNFSVIAGYNTGGNTRVFGIKTGQHDTKAVLYYYSNVNDSNIGATYCIVNNVFGHAQGAGCSGSYLWVGCKVNNDNEPYEGIHTYICRIPVCDVITKANSGGTYYSNDFLSYKVDISNIFSKSVGALTFHSSNTIIVRDIRWSTVNQIVSTGFDKMTILKYNSASNYKFSEYYNFYIHVPNSYNQYVVHSQNIFYDRVNGYFYAVYNDDRNDCWNKISVYQINGSPSGTFQGLPYYNAIKTISLDDTQCLDNDGVVYDKIEIESVALDANNKLLLAGNFNYYNGTDNPPETDRIIKLTNYNPSNPTA